MTVVVLGLIGALMAVSSMGGVLPGDGRQGAPPSSAPASAVPVDATNAADGTWARLDDAAAAFTLTTLPTETAVAGLAQLDEHTEAVQHASGGGRDDGLTIGSADTETPLLRLSIYRPGSEAAPSGSLFIDLARRASEAGLWIRRFAVLAPVDTQIGPLAAADVVLGSRQGVRACIAFRRIGSEPALRLSGWLCGAGAEPPSAEALACVINGVRWSGSAEEPAMARLFGASAAASRPGCNSTAPVVTGSTKQAPAPGERRKQRNR